MKVIGDSAAAIVTGAEVIDMKMQVTGMGFALNIDKLYTNKRESVIREICSNARDSMVSAGRGHIPFEIYLPSELSPYLIIKDTGLGMDKDDCIKYLSTLYASSKSNENQSVGSYGIGAKSPFAIADSYNIESCFNGMKYSFQFFRAGRSLPQLILLGEEKTEEPNGIAFKILVTDINRASYQAAIQTQLFMFDPKPLVDGSDWSFDIPKLELTLGDFSIYTSSIHRNYFGRCAVVMGGVTYPLSEKEFENPSLPYLLKDLSYDQILVLNVEIGALEVPGDRERLEYTEHTTKSLNNAFNGFADDFIKREVMTFADKLSKENWLGAQESHQAFYQSNKNFIYDNPHANKDSLDKDHFFPINIDDPDYEIIDAKGDSVKWGVAINPKRAPSSYFLPLPHHLITGKTKKEGFGPTQSNTPLYLMEEYLYPAPKYQFTMNSVPDFDRKTYTPKAWSALSNVSDTLFSTFTNNKRAEVILFVFVDSDKPLVKNVTWYIENTILPNYRSNVNMSLIYVRRNQNSLGDFKELEPLLQIGSNLGVDCKFVYLSKIQLPKVISTNKVDNLNRIGIRYIKVPSIIDSFKEGNQKVVYEQLKKDTYIGEGILAYYNTENDKGYFDQECTVQIDALTIRILGVFKKPLFLLSKTAVKREWDTFIELGCTPISEILQGQNLVDIAKNKRGKDLLAICNMYSVCVTTRTIDAINKDDNIDKDSRVYDCIKKAQKYQSKEYLGTHLAKVLEGCVMDYSEEEIQAAWVIHHAPEFVKLKAAIYKQCSNSFYHFYKPVMVKEIMNRAIISRNYDELGGIYSKVLSNFLAQHEEQLKQYLNSIKITIPS